MWHLHLHARAREVGGKEARREMGRVTESQNQSLFFPSPPVSSFVTHWEFPLNVWKSLP